jgi:hypothetical protein
LLIKTLTRLLQKLFGRRAERYDLTGARFADTPIIIADRKTHV